MTILSDEGLEGFLRIVHGKLAFHAGLATRTFFQVGGKFRIGLARVESNWMNFVHFLGLLCGIPDSLDSMGIRR
jgi:hypothetical protein